MHIGNEVPIYPRTEASVLGQTGIRLGKMGERGDKRGKTDPVDAS